MTTTAEDEKNPLEALGEALEAAAEALGAKRTGSGAADVEGAGADGGQASEPALSTAAYVAAYGASYALVFGAVFVKELLPAGSAVRRGLEDGARAGGAAAKSGRTREADPA